MIYCPNCHYGNEDGSNFCMSCGQKLDSGNILKDDTELMLQAAYYFREGEIVDKDVNRATEIYKKILNADNNNVRALYGLHWCFHNENDHQQNIKYWLPLVTKAANLGDAKSQVVLGDYYSFTAGNSSSLSSYKDALYWYGKAAEKDNTYALSCNAWIILRCDDAGIQDQKAAISYLEKAYSLEPDTFAHELGKAYYIVNSDELKDYVKAMFYCKRGAANGDWMAAYFVGKMYELGQGVEADIYNALSWYNLASSHGDEYATASLAKIADNKEKYNISISDDESVKYLEKASDISCGFCHSLMIAYELGKYGPIDHDKASFYVKKSEEVRIKKNENLVKPGADEQYRGNMFELRSIAYAKTLAFWNITPDNDIAKKKSLIETFEQNIKEHSDLWSLKTLVAILMGEKEIHREDSIEEPVIHSIPEVVDVKRAFELLDKGIAWGDKKCEQLLKHYISDVK